jgi:hypothetical protein
LVYVDCAWLGTGNAVARISVLESIISMVFDVLSKRAQFALGIGDVLVRFLEETGGAYFARRRCAHEKHAPGTISALVSARVLDVIRRVVHEDSTCGTAGAVRYHACVLRLVFARRAHEAAG